MDKAYKALKSYDEYEEEAESYTSFEKNLDDYRGDAENLRGEIKSEIEPDEAISQILMNSYKMLNFLHS